MLETLLSFSFIEWVGLLTGIIYVIFSAQNKIICWYFGIVSCACIAYFDFFGGSRLYSDGVLQVFYIVMGVLGLLRWGKVEVTFKSNMKIHGLYLLLGSLLSILYGWVMGQYTSASFPIIDAFTTVFSVLATILLVNRQLSAWIYFVVINIVMVYLYLVRGAELYGLLYIIFTIVSIYAIWKWYILSRLNLNKD